MRELWKEEEQINLAKLVRADRHKPPDLKLARSRVLIFYNG
jgi:hypothetical protein